MLTLSRTQETGMIVLAARLILMIHDNRSLKGKRQVVRSLIEKVRHRFGAAVAEVEDNDLWQRAQVGVALVGNDGRVLQSRMQQIMDYMDELHLAEIIDSHVELCYLDK